MNFADECQDTDINYEERQLLAVVSKVRVQLALWTERRDKARSFWRIM